MKGLTNRKCVITKKVYIFGNYNRWLYKNRQDCTQNRFSRELRNIIKKIK
jgi:hypothetical protein